MSLKHQKSFRSEETKQNDEKYLEIWMSKSSLDFLIDFSFSHDSKFIQNFVGIFTVSLNAFVAS